MRNKRALVMVATVIGVAGASLFAFRWVNQPRTVAPTGEANSKTLAVTSAALTQRSTSLMSRSATPLVSRSAAAVPRMNPYAVVQNGICVPRNVPNQEEASRKKWEALLRDPFWQSIFSGVNPEKFHMMKTSLPLQRYVTYWKMKDGQLIHWTGKKILIPAGTRVFTDGQGDMYLCACGNHVAAVLPPKTSTTVLPPGDEPPVAYLVPPEPDPFPATPRELAALAPPGVATTPFDEPGWLLPTTPLQGGSPILGEGSLPPGSGPGPGPIPGPPILVGGPSPPGGGPGPVPGPPGPPPVVPEPGTLSLTLIGLGACILSLYHRR